jgi:single-stranded-DNA-specific exonuclease
MNSRWIVPSFDPAEVKAISDSLQIPELMAKLLLHRGLKTAQDASLFLNPGLENLHSPFLFDDMEKAVSRIQRAVANKELIMIHGDYDIDGITATAILYHSLRQYTDVDKLKTYIPHRLNQGYGIKKEAIQVASNSGVSLIITVDCGITADDEIQLAAASGIDVIITDHHYHHSSPSDASAVIHPLLANESYPYKHLSGAGVAFKITQALEEVYGVREEMPSQDLLDLASAGTLGDIVQLDGENRIIAKHGLKKMKHTRWPGLKALLHKTKLNNKDLDSWHVGFVLGPRINAAGRMGDADMALNLLLSESYDECLAISDTLEDYNNERREIETRIYNDAYSLVHSQVNLNREPVIVLSNPSWHIGVLGIVASKLVSEFERPVILIGMNHSCWKGSGRSVDGFHIVEALEHCSEYLLGFGGHEMACGLSIMPEQINTFREAINNYALSIGFTSETVSSGTHIDALINLDEINPHLLECLTLLEPHGPGNPEPIFLIKGLHTDGRPRLIKNNHVKLHVWGNSCHAEAIWFGHAEDYKQFTFPHQRWDILGNARLNNYKGIQSIDIHIHDIQPSK